MLKFSSNTYRTFVRKHFHRFIFWIIIKQIMNESFQGQKNIIAFCLFSFVRWIGYCFCWVFFCTKKLLIEKNGCACFLECNLNLICFVVSSTNRTEASSQKGRGGNKNWTDFQCNLFPHATTNVKISSLSLSLSLSLC